jgi:hypothetical protein
MVQSAHIMGHQDKRCKHYIDLAIEFDNSQADIRFGGAIR